MPAVRLGFLGRAQECHGLNAVLARARDGLSAVLVVRGEPGIGKTALLRYVAREASGFRIIEVDGVQAEMELAFAGIQRLCGPMLDGLDALAKLQQNALRVAFGVSSGAPPDGFLVGVAVLNLLAAAAEERPLLCLVDDAQWLDAASIQALGFAARRLRAEPVAMLFSLREPVITHGFDGLPGLSLRGLDAPDAHALLARAVPGRLDERVRDRIIAETGGNPLALVELSQTMSPGERAGGFAAPPPGDLPPRLEEQYRGRVAGLPDATQHLMLLAAAEPLADASVLWRAAERLSIDPDALAPAAEAGLLEIDDRVRFHHPLVRSAVYRAASSEQRRRAHEALAQASDLELEADRQAWHLALAASGPDEAVAAALECAAGRAQRRGGLAATAALLERATWLTSDPKLQAARALAGAEASFQAGMFDVVARLLAAAEAGPLDEFQRARVDLVRGHATFASGLAGDGIPRLLTAARRLEGLDLELSRQTYLTAWGAATVAPGEPATGDLLLEISRDIRKLPRDPEPRGALELLLDGLALLTTEGRLAATPTLRRAAKAITDMPAEESVRLGWMATAASNLLWDNDGAYEIAARLVQLARETGALSDLPIYLSALGIACAWTGDLAGAASIMAEADSVAGAIGTASGPWIRLRLLSLQGKEADSAAAIALSVKQATAGAHGFAIYSRWAAAVLYNGLARYEEAATAAQQATSNEFEYWVSAWALPELVEAAAHVGDTARARDALERLMESTQPSANDLALGIEARCRALLSGAPIAERLFQDAIERLGRTRIRPELARSHLLYGEWLRREARLGEARERLRLAERTFADIGMEAFAERARSELATAGGKQRQRPREVREVREELTAQEQQIAGLARDGLTNAEIGAQLFISPRTVEWHLHKVFQKLGIKARAGLDVALPLAEPDAARV